jgi:hypothetical protein
VELEENGLAISVEVIQYSVRNFSIVTCCSAICVNLWDRDCFVSDTSHNTVFYKLYLVYCSHNSDLRFQ